MVSKQSSQKMSSMAAKVLGPTSVASRIIAGERVTDEDILQLARDHRSLAASVLSQDETPANTDYGNSSQ